MPDLSNTALAYNWNRAQDPNSQYGTRRLQFYRIEIVNYDITNEPGWTTDTTDEGQENNIDTYRVTYSTIRGEEFLESPKSILYPILRGIAQVGEIYFSGEPDSGPSTGNVEITSTYLVVALTEDTVPDGTYGGFPSTSKRLSVAIAESIADFSFGEVGVSAIAILGKEFQTRSGDNA